jgi:hypothetical protein
MSPAIDIRYCGVTLNGTLFILARRFADPHATEICLFFGSTAIDKILYV